MKTEEAISILKSWRITGDKSHEAVNMSIEALEKQIPKKPKRVGYFLMCPICYGRNGFDDNYIVTKQIGHDENISHCLVCGQAIDWEEGEG